ncbi:MAG: peptidylprolyl isomerase, partial [Planctomycetota bacterium]
MLRRILFLTIACVFILGQECIPTPGPSNGINVLDQGPQPQVTLETSMGNIVIELFSYQAPQSVQNFLQNVNDGYYDNTIFHDVRTASYINGGTYNPSLELNDTRELVNESNNGLINIRGRVSLFGPSNQDLGSPFLLINLGINAYLDFNLQDAQPVNYTVIGKVVAGMNVADGIGNVSTTNRTASDGTALNSIPAENVIITKAYVSTTSEDAAENQTPTANAGKNRFVAAGIRVALDGAASFDPDPNDTLTYHWVQTAGTEVQLSGSDTNRAAFTVPTGETQFVFELTVDDGNGGTDTASVTLTYTDTPLVRLKTSMGDIVIEIL